MDELQSSYRGGDLLLGGHHHDDDGLSSSDREDSPPPPCGFPVPPYAAAMAGVGAGDESAHAAAVSPDGIGRREDVIIHVPPKKGVGHSRWSHIDDLDSFFKKVYRYHQRHGFAVMMAQEVFTLVQGLFVTALLLFVFEFVDYEILFREKLPPGHRANDPLEKVHLSDCVRPFWPSVAGFSMATWLCLLVAFVVWCARALATFYHFFQFWDIKSFYNEALGIPDEQLASFTWHEVQSRVMVAQEEHRMCVHKTRLTELDVYHRILRFKNYMVAMVNKDLLPCKVDVPFVGKKVFLSHGLKYNLEFLFFKGPWAPFNQWHLKEEFKQGRKKAELAEQLRSRIALVAAVNLAAAPVVFVLQLIHAFFSYADLVKREPGSLGVRRWSQYGRLYLRHFNELDHELRMRLSRAYKPANKYMELFVSPLSVVVGQNVAFMAGSVLAVLMLLTVWDEDVLNVEHVLLIMTALGAIVAISRVFIPNENTVFCPEKTLTSVLAHIHYFPDAAWRGRAHCPEVMAALGDLFPYTCTHLLQELLSPLVTPFVLYFGLRPRAAAVVEFFKNFTVEVQGVGDVCSFAQMDVRRHGNTEWQELGTRKQQEEHSATAAARTTRYTRAEGGKTEMSLVHFSLVNPGWKPPAKSSGDFIAALREQVQRDAEALPTLPEEALPANPLYTSLRASADSSDLITGHHLEEEAKASNLYSSIAGQFLQEAGRARLAGSRSPEAAGVSSPPQGDDDVGGLSYRNVFSNAGVGGSSAMMTSSRLPVGTGMGSMLFTSRMGDTLAPPPAPNLRGDLRRLGLEYTAADMSLSALYLHELHHRSVVSHNSSSRNFGGNNYESASRYNFRGAGLEQQRRASLNELDEENLPLLDVAAPTSFRR